MGMAVGCGRPIPEKRVLCGEKEEKWSQALSEDNGGDPAKSLDSSWEDLQYLQHLATYEPAVTCE